MQGKIYGLLADGLFPSQIAKKLNTSPKTVSKWAKRYVEEGLLERVSLKPALYQAKKRILPPSMPVGNFTPVCPLYPHKFKVVFRQDKKPNILFNPWGKHVEKEQNHTIEIGRKKTIISIKGFAGNSPQEMRINALLAAQELAEYYGKKYAFNLTFDRVLPDIEWALGDKPASKEMNDQIGLTPQKEIAGALWKFDDSTHPKMVEINKAPNYPPENPTNHADTLYYLLMHAPNLLKQLAEGLLVVNTKVEIIQEELKSRRG